ncbi:hypothetical protein A2755_01205 [Candidatus Wolfebacteria bacterium RIFCSPHIGHO2_01_FULL_48_22]|uniref:FAD/NAD(P)-binding domain-containing protein n=2 Tax=Candidatus Wolfeibacteriota TaxID=1752735 RepID=A0A1F8DUQ7_9BACT|nr:MAG: hypothetical protein A2755_01205 [Candidatus Wolfebacteria bacterium RIFCSPHIGHO2_01_FULL_48_22]OGM93928.1 MAG: hypothetical protein A2935_03590 [Candidatus Wolfebacteria bacterium RIFCSPLOWO2_01_FULL_47_17b]
MFDLIILGGGPAAIGAGVYAARKRMKTLLLTKEFGGQSVDSAMIENFIGHNSISGVEFARVLEAQLRLQEDIEIKVGVTVEALEQQGDLWRVTDSKKNQYEARAVLVAIGSRYKRLNVPGEKQYEGKGVFFCSLCDAPLMKNKKAAVIGGGNAGLEAVVDLLPYATEIHLLVRGELKGDPIYQERIFKEEKVHVHRSVTVSRFAGSEFMEKVYYSALGSDEEQFVEAQGAFVEIGQMPNTELFEKTLTLSDSKHIVVDPRTMQTSAQGVWAAGDITDISYKQINTSIGDGIKAVLNIYETLQKNL